MSDQTNQSSEDQVTGVDVIDGVLTFRRYDGTTETYSFIDSLPTEDPEIANAIWNDGGTIMISTGP